jgi:hypothetical protein
MLISSSWKARKTARKKTETNAANFKKPEGNKIHRPKKENEERSIDSGREERGELEHYFNTMSNVCVS